MTSKKRTLDTDHVPMRMDCPCQFCCDYQQLPSKITVNHASIDEVNGEYYRLEIPGLLLCYAKDGPWKGIYHQFWIRLFPTKQSHGLNEWQIVAVPKPNLDGSLVKDKVQLYYYPTNVQAGYSEGRPPLTGWIKYGGDTSSNVDTLELQHHDSINKEADPIDDDNNNSVIKKSRVLAMVENHFFHSRIRTLETYLPRLETMVHHPGDQDTVYASMFRFLFSNPCGRKTALRRVDKDVGTMVQKERYNALELAVWKMVCWMHYPTNESNGTYDLLSWWTKDWKNAKANVRRCSGKIDVIMQHVIAFDKKKK